MNLGYLFRFGASVVLIATLALSIASAVPRAQLKGGIDLFRSRVSQNPKDYLSQTLLGEVLNSYGRMTGDMAAYEEAADVLGSALKTKPDHKAAKYQLAVTLLGLHKFKESEKILQLLDNSPANAALISDSLFEQGLYKDAIAKLSSVEDTLNTDPAFHYRKARFAEIYGDNKEAVKLLQLALAVAIRNNDEPANVAWYHLQLGERYLRIGRLQSAANEYKEARKLAPDSAAPLEHLAELAGSQKQFEEAIKLIDLALKINPTAGTRQAKGDLLALMGGEAQTAEAQSIFQELKSTYERSLSAGHSYYLHHAAGFYSDSLLDPISAVKYAAQDLEERRTIYSLATYAWALYRAGRFAEADTEMRSVLRYGVKDPHLFYQAGMIRSATGDFKAGKQLFKEADKLNPFTKIFHIHR